MAFGKPTLEQFHLEGTIPDRRDAMLKQRKSVRRKKQERENGVDLLYPVPHGRGKQKGQGWKTEVYPGKKEIQGENLALICPWFSLSTCFHWQWIILKVEYVLPVVVTLPQHTRFFVLFPHPVLLRKQCKWTARWMSDCSPRSTHHMNHHQSRQYILHAQTVHMVMALGARLCLLLPGPLKKIIFYFSLHRDTWNIPQISLNPLSSEGCLVTCQWPATYWLPQKWMSENIKAVTLFPEI